MVELLSPNVSHYLFCYVLFQSDFFRFGVYFS